MRSFAFLECLNLHLSSSCYLPLKETNFYFSKNENYPSIIIKSLEVILMAFFFFFFDV